MPDSSLCRAAAPRLRPLQLLLLARLHRSVSTSAELPACIHFSCFSPLTSASVASLDCVRLNWFPIASASAVVSAPDPNHPSADRFPARDIIDTRCDPCWGGFGSGAETTSAAAPRMRRLQLCSPMASASAAAPRMRRLQLCSPMASASAAAPRMRRLQLCSPMIWRPLRLLLPDCVRFGCAAAPRQLFSKIPAM